MNFIGTALLAVFCSFFLISCAGQGSNQEQDNYMFGAVFPLTGATANQGVAANIGLRLAIDDINQKGGINGLQVKVSIEDSAGDKLKAVTAAQKILEVDGADALFTVTTPMGGVLAPIAESHKVPLVYGSATNAFAANKSYVFKDYPDAFDDCQNLAQRAKKEGHDAVALFGTNAEFTYLCKEGASIVLPVSDFETYNPGDQDFRTQFTKIKGSNASALILLAFSTDCLNAFKEIRELNINANLYLSFQSFACGSDENSKADPGALAGAIGSDVKIDTTNPSLPGLYERIEKEGGTPHMRTTLMVYDFVQAMAKAYDGCNGNHDCAAKNLEKQELEGVTGRIFYGKSHVAHRDVVLTRFNGKDWSTF